MEGGIGFGLGAALYGAITLKKGQCHEGTETVSKSVSPSQCD
jgi:hypothetical protein